MELKKKIEKNLRMQGKNQSFICEILNLKQGTVSQKINGQRKWKDWELDDLRANNLI